MMIMMANAARLEALDEMTLANPNQSKKFNVLGMSRTGSIDGLWAKTI